MINYISSWLFFIQSSKTVEQMSTATPPKHTITVGHWDTRAYRNNLYKYMIILKGNALKGVILQILLSFRSEVLLTMQSFHITGFTVSLKYSIVCSLIQTDILYLRVSSV